MMGNEIQSKLENMKMNGSAMEANSSTPHCDPSNDLSTFEEDIDHLFHKNKFEGKEKEEDGDEDFNTFSSSALRVEDDDKPSDQNSTEGEDANDSVPTQQIGTYSMQKEENNADNNQDDDENIFSYSKTSLPTRRDIDVDNGNNQSSPHEAANDSHQNDQEYSSNDYERTDHAKFKRYVTPQDFELLKVIGMGAFGKVLQVRNKISKQILAMKIISKRLLKRKSTYIENIQAEREILKKVKHPFVVTMHCSFQTKEKLFIIMDFLAGGELFLRIGREGIFLEKTAAFYVAEIVLALEHLHSKGVLHRDLKPENILLSTDGHLCLTDFGLAKDFNWHGNDGVNEDGKALTVCGTQEYMAPEMVARKGYGRAADWWSLGCIAYEMMGGKPPFESRKGAKDLFRKIMSEKVKMPDGLTAAACVLLKGLLNKNATARFGAAKGTMFQVGGVAQVKQLAFFAGIDWGLLEQKKVEPPVKLDVENELDTRHFYDEFTSMGLPRSVKEMSHEHFKPRRCQSGAFRGFSFIQDDFVLPDRTDEHVEEYWNNIDEDGESRSDCASSLGGMDDDTVGTQKAQRAGNMVPSLEPTPEMAATKKKRPPRKRKKKQLQQNDDVDKKEAGKHATLDTNSPNEKVVDVIKENTQNKEVVAYNECKITRTSASEHNANAPTSVKEAKQPEQLIKVEPSTESTWKTPDKSKDQRPSQESETKATFKPKTEHWESVSKPKKEIGPRCEAVRPKDNNNDKCKRIGTNAIPNATENRSNAPWGPKTVNNPLPKQQNQTKQSSQVGGAGATDWRSHTLTRNVSGIGHRNIQQSTAPSTFTNNGGWPSLSDVAKNDKADLWPSLGKPAGKTATPNAAPQSMKPKTPQGSWAANVISGQSAWAKPKR